LIVQVDSPKAEKDSSNFKSKPEGESEIRRILNRGSSSKPKVTEADEAAFTLAKAGGLSPQQMLDAIRLFKQQVQSVN